MQNKYKDLLFLLDKLPEAVIVISSNKVNYINNKARELLDYYLPLNKPLQYLLNCFQEVDIINFINNYLKNPLNLVVKEVKIFNPKELYLKAVFSPLRSSSFKKGSIIILHDITEEKRLQKLKDDFIANVSHEFKTPLAIIKESISLLLDKVIGKLNNEQEKCLSITYSNIERLTRLIHNILDFSKIEEGHIVLHRELTDINKLAINIFNFFKHNAENRNIKFNLIINHNFPLIYLDSDKITQVITNLISNALQFTNPGGKITLAVKMFKSNICISVQDTGIGIKKEDKEKIFHKFHQINKEDSYGKKGTGLVLTISKSIIRLHGGDLNVKSKHGKGSEFYFNIPLTTEYLSIVNSLFEADNSKDKLKSLNYLKSEGASKVLIEILKDKIIDRDIKEKYLKKFQELKLLKGITPDSLDHIEDFFLRKIIIDGKPVKAAGNIEEAFLMAYIEKNMGNFSYKGRQIFEYDDSGHKKKALINLVKDMNKFRIKKELSVICN